MIEVYTTYRMPDYSYSNVHKWLAEETNTLVVGWVGSGKSEVIHGIIHYLASATCPGESDLWLCDPKMVELEMWRPLPHVTHYADNAEDIISLLSLLHDEMMSRYEQMKDKGLVKWEGNQIYLVIDELADLLTGPYRTKVTTLLTKILQLSRAAGIHCIAGAQKASRDILPSRLIANFTAQVALKCYSAIESRQVIGMSGAEALPGPGYGYINRKGECTLYLIPMVELSEKRRIIEHWRDGRAIVKRTRKWRIFK